MNKPNRKHRYSGEAIKSQMRSAEILRVAKEMAEKSHQKAILARKSYIAQQKRTLQHD